MLSLRLPPAALYTVKLVACAHHNAMLSCLSELLIAYASERRFPISSFTAFALFCFSAANMSSKLVGFSKTFPADVGVLIGQLDLDEATLRRAKVMFEGLARQGIPSRLIAFANYTNMVDEVEFDSWGVPYLGRLLTTWLSNLDADIVSRFTPDDHGDYDDRVLADHGLTPVAPVRFVVGLGFVGALAHDGPPEI